jgi:hypothetical protein
VPISSVVSNAPANIAVAGSALMAGTDSTKKITDFFEIDNDMSLAVSFNRNRFIDMAGVYNGLYSVSANPTIASSGLLDNMSVNTKGTYSAKLISQGVSTTIKGAFTSEGTTSVTAGNLVLSGLLDWVNSATSTNKQFIGTVSNTVDGWSAAVTADQAVKGLLVAGTKNTILIGGGANGSPAGSSFGKITDSASSRGFSFTLADGATSATATSMPGNNSGNYPIYVYPKYKDASHSALFGTWNTASNQVTLNWVKATGGTIKPDGFANTSVADISAFSTGLAGVRTVNITNGAVNLSYQMSFPGVGLATFVSGPTNLIAIKQDPFGKLTVKFGTGVGKATAQGLGGVLQTQSTGGGFIITTGNNDTGTITITNP